jgi:hypothetical protein
MIEWKLGLALEDVTYLRLRSCVIFSNGIHRPRVPARHSNFVSLSAGATFYRKKELAAVIVREIARDELFPLPNLSLHDHFTSSPRTC